jgi:hypothetical protein
VLVELEGRQLAYMDLRQIRMLLVVKGFPKDPFLNMALSRFDLELMNRERTT